MILFLKICLVLVVLGFIAKVCMMLDTIYNNLEVLEEQVKMLNDQNLNDFAMIVALQEKVGLTEEEYQTKLNEIKEDIERYTNKN